VAGPTSKIARSRDQGEMEIRPFAPKRGLDVRVNKSSGEIEKEVWEIRDKGPLKSSSCLFKKGLGGERGVGETREKTVGVIVASRESQLSK